MHMHHRPQLTPLQLPSDTALKMHHEKVTYHGIICPPSPPHHKPNKYSTVIFQLIQAPFLHPNFEEPWKKLNLGKKNSTTPPGSRGIHE
jgi:hypothetical protein